MVVIFLPAASLTNTPHERIATPSIWTVQAPHCAMPQPYLVPVRPTRSRIAHSSGMAGSASTVWILLLIFSVKEAIVFMDWRLNIQNSKGKMPWIYEEWNLIDWLPNLFFVEYFKNGWIPNF